MHKITRAETRPEAAGLVIHGAAKYDFIVWLFTLGGERRMRERMLRLARLKPGEHVLDMGCGTGTLAILAKRQVGDGLVYGVDASPEMVVRAGEKAKRAGVEIVLKEGAVQDLPLADASVDVVLCTLMLHHVPKRARAQIAREVRRVLKPGGRFLAVDFMKPSTRDRSVWSRFHRHGAIELSAFAAELAEAGLPIAESGPLGEKNMHYLLAGEAMSTTAQSAEVANNASRARPSVHILALIALVALVLLALHAGAIASTPTVFSALASSPWAYALVAGIVLILVLKIALLHVAHHFAGGVLTRWLGAREEGRD